MTEFPLWHILPVLQMVLSGEDAALFFILFQFSFIWKPQELLKDFQFFIHFLSVDFYNAIAILSCLDL